MRFGKLFFVITLFAAISMAVLMLGCSKDSTTSPVADNGYSTVQSEFGLYADSLMAQLNSNLTVYHNLDAVDSNIVVAYSPVDPDSTRTIAGWKIVYASDLVAGYSIYLIDSLQFKANGVVQTLAHGADQMQVIRHWGVENPDTTVTYRNVDVVSSFLFTGLTGTTVTVNGDRQSTIQTKIVGVNSSVKRQYAIDMVTTNVTFPKVGPNCPQTGTLGGTVVQTIDRGSVPVTTSWQYDLTIDAGAVTGQVTAGAWQAAVTGNLCQ